MNASPSEPVELLDDAEIREQIRIIVQQESKYFQIRQAAKNTGNGDLFREALEVRYQAQLLRTQLNNQLTLRHKWPGDE